MKYHFSLKNSFTYLFVDGIDYPCGYYQPNYFDGGQFRADSYIYPSNNGMPANENFGYFYTKEECERFLIDQLFINCEVYYPSIIRSLRKTTSEIIQENIDKYSNPSNRGYCRDEKICQYITADNRKCAIGRVMIDPEKAQIEKSSLDLVYDEDEDGNSSDTGTWKIGNIIWDDNLLFPEYRGQNPKFWRELQTWHDNDYHFDNEKNCLTKKGVDSIENIKEIFVD